MLMISCNCTNSRVKVLLLQTSNELYQTALGRGSSSRRTPPHIRHILGLITATPLRSGVSSNLVMLRKVLQVTCTGLDLQLITCAAEAPVVVHGTNKKYWDSIKHQVLVRVCVYAKAIPI